MSTATRRYTYEDLRNTPDDGKRYEIIDGELIVSAAPVKKHQWLLYLLTRAFGDHVDRRKLGRIYFAPVDVKLFDDYVEPDLIFIRKDRLGIYEESIVDGPPDAVLEILSPTTRHRDLGVKRALYERARVPEYWIADPDKPELLLFVLNAEGRSEQALPENGSLRSRVLPGFAIDFRRLFADLAAD
jgi:Uma2 family endonuclease